MCPSLSLTGRRDSGEASRVQSAVLLVLWCWSACAAVYRTHVSCETSQHVGSFVFHSSNCRSDQPAHASLLPCHLVVIKYPFPAGRSPTRVLGSPANSSSGEKKGERGWGRAGVRAGGGAGGERGERGRQAGREREEGGGGTRERVCMHVGVFVHVLILSYMRA